MISDQRRIQSFLDQLLKGAAIASMLVCSAAAIRLSLHALPAGEASAVSRIRAFSS